MQPPKFFLSHCRKDAEELKIIARILMAHGIRTWQDINNLGSGLTESEIRRAIQEDCNGLVFYSTADSLKSPMVRDVELKVGEEKFLKDKNFHIVPVFKSTIDEANTALRGYLKTNISDFNGAIVKGDDFLVAGIRTAAVIFKNLVFSNTDFMSVGLCSYQKTCEEVSLDCDFTPYFSLGLPPEKVWNEEFVPALRGLKDALLSKNNTKLRLFSRAHLSLGIMFGYIFRDRTGFTLEIEQINKPDKKIWSTVAKEEPNLVKIEITPVGNLDSKNLVVNINLISNDNNSFSNYVQKSGLRYRAMIEAHPVSYPCLVSNGEALSFTKELIDKIKSAHGAFGTNTVHIFAAIPLGLALFIGYHLNACGQVQCYEFDKAKREYFPSANLENF
ncbi:MAG: SAVED domain-containing protein [Candidatus Omnitrophota bacterium]|nr:SAVED domain-containing protein [Candidatus Omnitrophota bacterium]